MIAAVKNKRGPEPCGCRASWGRVLEGCAYAPPPPGCPESSYPLPIKGAQAQRLDADQIGEKDCAAAMETARAPMPKSALWGCAGFWVAITMVPVRFLSALQREVDC